MKYLSIVDKIKPPEGYEISYSSVQSIDKNDIIFMATTA